MTSSTQSACRIIDTIGPVFSNSGLKNWDLCLAGDKVIACPRSFWITLRAGLWAGVGGALGHFMMQRQWDTARSPSGQRLLQDDGDTSWRRYTLQELGSITVKRGVFSANEIRITRRGMKPDIYGLADRRQTDRCRAALKELYPGLYNEENF